MLRNTEELLGYSIAASDGLIGHVKDFYFDDHAWVLRYMVVDTGSWLARRSVLLSPVAAGRPNRADRTFPVAITREQVARSPDIDTDKPVSRQHERRLLRYYDYPYYWEGAGTWGNGAFPNLNMPVYDNFAGVPTTVPSRAAATLPGVEADAGEDGDPHLRSCDAVIGYEIQAIDGAIGHVEGFLLDDDSWAIRYLVVDTSVWWSGHRVLVPPQWITEVSWPFARVAVQLTRERVARAPLYERASTLDRAQELAIYRHYGRPGYWIPAETTQA